MLKGKYKTIKFDNLNLKSRDYLGTRLYSEELIDMINNYFSSSEKKPLYIGIIGDWGSGKSSIVETALEEMRINNKNIKIFNYDAWKYEGDSFRRDFIENILKQSGLNEENITYKEVKEQLYEDKAIQSQSIIERMNLSRKKDKKYKSLPAYIGAIIVIIFTIILYFLTGDSTGTTFGFTISLLGYMGALNMLYATTTYSITKYFSVEQFYDAFEKIIKKSKGNKNIIFIDNIDRCDSEMMIDTLKSIKGFFGVQEKMIYIIPFDKTSFVEAYGEKYAQFYIDKIFDSTIDIKKYNNSDKLDFIIELLKEYSDYSDLFNSTIKDMVSRSHFDTPREILNVLNSYITEYNIMVKKNSIHFFKEDYNLEYLMKYTILKLKFPSMFELGHKNITEFKDVESRAFESNFKDKDKYPFITDKLISFLSYTRSIVPLDYTHFYSLQNSKNYRLEYEYEQMIIDRDYEKIDKIIDSEGCEKFLEYLKRSISHDVDNSLWTLTITPKLLFLIHLIRTFRIKNDEDKNKLVAEWHIVWDSQKFIDEIIYGNLISFEEAIFVAREVDNVFRSGFIINSIIDGLVDNRFKMSDSQVTENVFILFNECEVGAIDDKQNEFVNTHIKKIIDDSLYKTEEFNGEFPGGISPYISEDNYVYLLSKLNNEDIITVENVLTSIKNDFKTRYRERIFNAMINLFNGIGSNIKDFNLIEQFFEFLEQNKQKPNWASNVGALNVELKFEEASYPEFYTKILNIYNDFASQNNTINNIILNSRDIANRNAIFNYINDYVSQQNNHIIELIKVFIQKLEFTEYGNNINKILNFYEHNQNIVKEWFVTNCINNEKNYINITYRSIDLPEKKEQFVNDCIEKLSTFELEIKSIILFESSNNRFVTFINKYTEIEKIVTIITNCNKASSIALAYDRLLKIIENKDNILDNEFDSIMNLLTSNLVNKNSVKSLIKLILNGKVSPQNLFRIYNEIDITDNSLLDYIKSKLIEYGLLELNPENKEEELANEEQVHE